MSDKPKSHAPFYASNAYTILGHGSELSTSFKVPHGCMIISLGHPGELILGDRYIALIENMVNMDMNILLNPLEHKRELFEAFGALSYHGPGEMCPEYQYNLLSAIDTTYNSELEHNNIYSAYPGSGIVNISTLQHYAKDTYIGDFDYYEKKAMNKFKTIKTVNEYNHHLIMIIMDMFHNNLVPINIKDILTKDVLHTIHMKYEKYYEEELRQGPNYEYFEEPEIQKMIYMEALQYLYKSPHMQVSQRVLCNTLPGIYYNFVCKSMDTMTHFYNWNNMREKIPTIPELKRLIKKNPENAKYKNMLSILKRRIGDFSRKSQARKYYTSSTFKKKYTENLENFKQHLQNRVANRYNELGHELPKFKEKLRKLKQDRLILTDQIDELESKLYKFERQEKANIKLLKEYNKNSFTRRFENIKKPVSAKKRRMSL